MNIFQQPEWKNFISRCTSHLKKFNQSHSLKKLKEKLKEKCENVLICQANIRQMTVLLLLAFFLTTGMVQNIQAASSEYMPLEPITAQRVIINGKEAGYVCDPVSAYAVMDEILQDAAALYGMEIVVENELHFEETDIPRERLSTKSDLEESLRKNSQILVNAYTIYVNNVPIATLKSEEEAQLVLDNVKAQYISDADADALEDVSFQEDVQVVSAPTHFHQIQGIEEVEAELEKEQDVVEEYTIHGDDTFWSIAQKYNIDVDELTKINSEKNPKELRDGMVIQLSYPKCLLNVVSKELTEYAESICFKTETQNDNSMYKNKCKVVREGKEGKKNVKAYIIKVNGVEIEREILSEEIVLEPVNKIVAKGTKKEVTAASIARGYGKFKWPTSGHITSGYGQRWGRLHKGIDIANSKGTPIYAAESGTVTATGQAGSYGKRVIIDHGSDITTLYAHMSSIKVSSGKKVSRGDLIGYMGSTGNSTGPHLHFEVRINGTARNPLKYLN